jgi:DNA-binding winged helix-turn-helix (wHTH) protein
VTERIHYEFEGFLLDPTKRLLLHHGQPTSLRPTAFNLLLSLVEQHGKTVSKEQLLESVWGSGSGYDRRLHVTLHEVRRKLGDSAKKSRFIARDTNGYRFVANVRKLVSANDPASDVKGHLNRIDEDSDQQNFDPIACEQIPVVRDPEIPLESDLGGSHDDLKNDRRPKASAEGQYKISQYLIHVLVSSSLYAALYGVAIILEVSYEFTRFGRSALKFAFAAFLWIMLTSSAALIIDSKLTDRGKRAAQMWSIAALLISALLLVVGASRFLPITPISKLSFQSYSAQAAYLKDTVYFLVLAVFFISFPFHNVVRLGHEINKGRAAEILQTFSERLSGRNAYVRVWALTAFLIMLALASLAMTAHLLDNLKTGPHMNLFTQLVYLRGILYFGLGIECLLWYYHELQKLEAVAKLRAKQDENRNNVV